jgi:ADP-heptose:LPS heptosyltransferase
LSAVGDTILSLPILCALRRQFPNAELGWVVARGASDLLHEHPCLDRLFILPTEAMKSPSAYVRFALGVRAWRPEIVLDAQGLTKSSAIGWLSGAKRRIGLAASEFEGRELSTWLNNEIVVPKTQHVVDRGLELLRPLGISLPCTEYRVAPFPAERERVQTAIARMGLTHPWGILNVGAGWISKVWPSQRYADVAMHLSRRWGLQSVVVWGSPKERSAAEQVVALSHGCAVLAPATSLQELSEWIRNAQLFVGSDTGPMHLAVALDIPTVGMIGPMPVERVGPRGPRHASVQRERLPESMRSQRKTDCRPMLSIDSRSVCDACDGVLSGAKNATRAA